MKKFKTGGVIVWCVLLLASCGKKEKQVILPPFKGLEKDYVATTFDVATGGVLTTESGTVLEVPAHAFMDSLGRKVIGEVDLHYRELHTPEDIFLSGIPMEVSSGSKTEVLSSAVMWEVRAFQQGKELELDSSANKTIRTTIASYVEGDQYDMWGFDEQSGNWTNMSSVQPEPNPLRIEADSLVGAAGKELASLDLSNSFVLNYYQLIDVWKPSDKVFNYFYGAEGTPEEAYTKKLKSRVESFDMQWSYAQNEYSAVVYYGKSYPAAMMVWETDEKLPKKSKSLKEGYYECQQVGRHRYRISFYKYPKNYGDDPIRIHSLVADIKMPLKSLYQVGAEKWEANQDSLVTALEAQEKRLETLGTVRRTFEISQMGVYNYDVLLDKTRDLTVEASFTLNGEEIENEDDLLVYVYLAENRSVVRYNRYDFDKFVLYPDADYKVFCVTGPGQLAFLPPESLNEIIDLMPVLRNIETPPVNFDMVKYKHNISTPADIMTFLNGAEQVAVVR